MNKTHAAKKGKKIRGTAYELISIMTIVSCTAIERCFSPHAKERSAVLAIYKDEQFLKEMKDAFTHNKDLSVLAKNFGTFIRVAEKVARGQGHDIGN